MNILLSSHYFYPHIGGIESVVDDHARRLTNRGHDVTVVTSAVGTDQQRSQRHGYEIRRFNAWNPVERFGIPYPVPDPVDVRRTLKTLLNDVPVDVFHAHGMNYLTNAALMRSVPSEIPTFLHQHTPFVEYPTPISFIERWNDGLIGRYNLRNADYVYCVSPNIEKYVRGFSTHVQTEVLPNGIDTDVFHPSHATQDSLFECPPERPVFFILSRLCRKKGIDLLLEAARQLDERSIDAHIVIAGDGPMREEVDRAAVTLENVEAIGRVPNATLPQYYATADAALFTSKSGEAFPTLTMLEAFASGTPVIASKLAEAPKGIDDGVNTLLVEPGDPQALQEAIVELANNTSKRTEMGPAARVRAKQHFSLESRIDRLEAAYESAVGAESPRSALPRSH